mgnify:CR=1 FL=1
MVKIIKRSGMKEDFDSSKIEKSLTRTGLDLETATKIASEVEPEESTNTSVLREKIKERLDKIEPEIASEYSENLRRRIYHESETPEGEVFVSGDTLKALSAKEGDTLQLTHQKNIISMEANKYPYARAREIYLNKIDFDKLGVTEGKKILIKKAQQK